MTKDVRVLARETLADGFGRLDQVTFAYRRYDGTPDEVEREVYVRDDAAAILLYDPQRKTVLLIKQMRPAAFVNGGEEDLIQVPAGKLEGMAAALRIVEEVFEETGYRITAPRQVFAAYMSPAVMTEKITFFVARYSPADRENSGGGLAHEGEDIALLETTLPEALEMIERGTIVDIKTISLLHYAALHRLLDE